MQRRFHTGGMVDKLSEIKIRYDRIGLIPETVAARRDDINWLVSERERLRKALEKYGRHLDNCDYDRHWELNYPCSCGLREALKGI